jgi:hypothetical protein
LGSADHLPKGASDAPLVADAHSIMETLPITAGAPLDAVPRHTRLGGRRLGEHAPLATPVNDIQACLAPRLHSQRTIAPTQLEWQAAIFDLLLDSLSEVCGV